MSALTVENPPSSAPAEQASTESELTHRPKPPGVRRYWYWAAVPLIAVAAYATVLRIGFMDDDWVLLYLAHRPGLDWRALLPGSQWFFYRPVGVFLTWELGWELWGINPLPYHLVGLLAHAATALALALWLADLTGKPGLGWLAGALFGVFPLHLEAVGWVATQWDVWATLFGLLSMWSFMRWWRGGRRNALLYGTSVLLYGLAIFSKESLLTFLPIVALSAWLAVPARSRHDWKVLALALLPFGAVIGLNVALRLVMLGDLGNYQPIRSDYNQFFWDNFTAYLRPLLSPINSLVLGGSVAQVVGLVSSVALLGVLVLYGRDNRRLLLLAGAWVFLSLLPVLSIPGVRGSDLLQNRYLYLTSAGYLVGVAVLLYAAITSVRRLRTAAISGVGLLVLLGIAACWVQLRSWHTATVQVDAVIATLLRLIPSEPRPNGFVWYVENMPEEYKGAYMLRRGLGLSRLVMNGGVDYPRVERTLDATQAPFIGDGRDAFAIRFKYLEQLPRYVVDYASGITAGSEPPPSDGGEGLTVWDFRGCEDATLEGWRVAGARSTCEPGEGLKLQPVGNDPQVVGPALDLRPGVVGASFVRLRVAVRYPQASTPEVRTGQWYWQPVGGTLSEETSRSTPLKEDGQSHVYWTFLPADAMGVGIERLRFDPANGPVSSTIEWIAVDLVD